MEFHFSRDFRSAYADRGVDTMKKRLVPIVTFIFIFALGFTVCEKAQAARNYRKKSIR